MQRSSFHDTLATRGLTVASLDSVLQGALFGMFIDHGAEGCVYANDALLEAFEIDWEAYRGFGWAKWVLQEDQQRLQAAVTDFEHHTDSFDIRYRIRTPKGNTRVLHANVQAVLGPDGERVGSIGIVRDVSLESVSHQEALSNQKKQALGELSSRVAFQVNNTLQTILSSEQALANEPLSPAGRKLLTGMKEAVMETASLARELAGLGTDPESSRSILDLELSRKLQLYRELLGDRVHFQPLLKAPNAIVGLTPTELNQVMLHLLLTARCMLDGQGELRLSTKSSGEAVILELLLAPNSVCTTDALPFSQRTERLGQAAVRSILHLVGGTLEIEDSTIQLRLPVIFARTLSSTKDPLRVLLVDDHTALRQSLAHAVALHGHTVLTASSVIEALESLTDTDVIDVVVTDLLLQDGDGSEVSVAARRQNPPATVVFMSGYQLDAVKMIHAIDPKAPFLQKPFGPRDLIDAIDSCSVAPN